MMRMEGLKMITDDTLEDLQNRNWPALHAS